MLDGERPSPSTSIESILAFDAADYFTDDSSDEEKFDIEEGQDDKDFVPILASNQTSRQCSLCYRIKKFVTRMKDNARVLQSSARIFCGVILEYCILFVTGKKPCNCWSKSVFKLH